MRGKKLYPCTYININSPAYMYSVCAVSGRPLLDDKRIGQSLYRTRETGVV